MIDAHAHLGAAPAAGDGWLIPGVDGATDAAAARLATDSRVWRAVGLHPWYLDGDLDAKLAALRARVTDDVVAIGETGLDAMRRAGPRDRQERAFRAQIRLAMEHGLPLILHVVRRHGACLDVLAAEGFLDGDGGVGGGDGGAGGGDGGAGGARPRGMVHDFGGPAEMIGPWVAAGFCLSISPRSVVKEHRRGLVAAIPDEALLIETDDFGPDRLGAVAAWVADARGVPVERLTAQTDANLRRLVGEDGGRRAR